MFQGGATNGTVGGGGREPKMASLGRGPVNTKTGLSENDKKKERKLSFWPSVYIPLKPHRLKRTHFQKMRPRLGK